MPVIVAQKIGRVERHKYLLRHIEEHPRKIMAWNKYPMINNLIINIEYMKASVKEKVSIRFRSSNISSDSPKLATIA